MKPAFVRTPAKLNLGLEVVGRRPDGYHDLVTVFQAIDLYDELHAMPGVEFRYDGDPSLGSSDDIARPILETAARQQHWTGRLELRKRIPISAGLGGGSSDAALALRIAMFGQSADEIRALAASLGADGPFFVEGGTALGTGIGEQLERLPQPLLWFVIVTPQIEIRDKTTTLYAGLIADDFSSGDSVRDFARGLSERARPEPVAENLHWAVRAMEHLPNSFGRQMLVFPAVCEAWKDLESLAGRVALSGAGPTVYSWHASYEEARGVYERMEKTGRLVHVARTIERHVGYKEVQAIQELHARLSTQRK